jgi:hypothetical protein
MEQWKCTGEDRRGAIQTAKKEWYKGILETI